ncbi:dipeptide/oligopeptide/nickel ABC transporter ATP-binding protein [uncultured Ilyobacter sp.]|uniref:ABC transporter ATP-binding protein n=1 Tax=uncultured Ilyobacter sp. TaxID=544433 RepID=UPI0029F49680|nr:dipeptide/oligopeptide/nickel ABC transporter ATP-binding protein [uncultured Ilyobacter sp.]
MSKLFDIKNLTVKFNKGSFKALDGVNLCLKKGEILGVLGESGGGKSTLANSMTLLNDRYTGEILYRGKEIKSMNSREKKIFSKEVQLIFQDPYSSLNPKMRLKDIILEGAFIHGLIPKNASDGFVKKLLKKVGLKENYLDRYPGELSGGERQKAAIARALALFPDVIIFDEATTNLDLVSQREILNIILELQKSGVTCAVISHNLPLINIISDRVIVINKGKIKEEGKTEDVFSAPKSKYLKETINNKI